ncbi:ATP-dependent exonuclase V beta subunit, helicase and exonuclease domain-containing [Halorubrum saccharovorum DSM 1137]|uniref:DNA 3'-5' helicase n=1 Tax=Halorubrum saccharovorum DSM 1137 TaxID=1227484 RepID=M0DU11_9EURY|nr:ATP-dependent DNA helicase [Halorubrum saccharovorum]ELZ38328.1 ATP-dependent exonuclase V beta subunit, helicase and exonuclease domain-containing [Halorubrum saccharovorum DSM 1137]
MSDIEPNPEQRELINAIEGLYLVDAGAGTGKTFTVTRRYANIVEQDGIAPSDVLLVTFTNNAAEEMRDRIVRNSEYGMRELSNAPIQTFHSLAHDILDEHGHDAPTYLGVEETITGSTRIIEDDIIEQALFREFIGQFIDSHPEYNEFFTAISETTELLNLIKELSAKGVFPTATGWYRDGESHLDGDFAAFETLFADINQPRNGGSKQSKLRSKLSKYGKEKTYLPEAPERWELRGNGKQIPADVAGRVFEDDRTALKQFVHDVYHAYLEFALRRNYLNFGFLQLFAFVLLCEDHDLRDRLGYEYVMVDEFQDSSEIQFKLMLLLAGTENICVVGDWKQSIYSFQYADVDNIREFDERLDRFAEELNRDADRVTFPTTTAASKQLTRNYRSTQSILRFSTQALTARATNSELLDVEAISEAVTRLKADTDHDESRIEALTSEDEHEAILAKIDDIVDNDDYAVEGDDGEYRAPKYGDIAVLTRTRDFGRDLLDTANAYDLPMAYEGGIEVFRTDAAKLLLAWLRILERNADRGWALVLEEAGYTIDEVKAIIDRDAYPDAMVAFREELREMETFGGVARRVFDRYDRSGPTADVVLDTVQSVYGTTTFTRGELIQFIEAAIEDGSTHEVDAGAGTNAVTVQTIHATKGLEYPIVILANMNTNKFPSTSGSGSDIAYTDPIGLRQRKVYSEEAHDVPHVYDNWQTDVLNKCLSQNYDEERRLLYVAITRAESHVILTGGENPNVFLDELPVNIETVDPDLSSFSAVDNESSPFTVDIPDPDGPASYSPHTFIDDAVFEGDTGGRGMEFGSEVHEFAERYVLEEAVDTDGNTDKENVKKFLDSLDGEKKAEIDAFLPLTVDDKEVTIGGIIDLLHITPDQVDIIDYKTDLTTHAEDEYEKQLSIYYHVVADQYPDRSVSASIFYTDDGNRRRITHLSKSDLREMVRTYRA